MDPFENVYRVDLLGGTAPVVPLRQIYQGDADANRITAQVFRGPQPVSLAGTVSGTAILANGATIPLSGSYSGNTAYVDLSDDCYTVPGIIKAFLKITHNGATQTLLAAAGTVVLTETPYIVDPDGSIALSVATLINAINEAIGDIPADYSTLLEAIAPYYDDLVFPVSAGAYCWYSGTLYKAKADISASESWTAAHWETAIIGEDLAEIRRTAASPSAIAPTESTSTASMAHAAGEYFFLAGTLYQATVDIASGGTITPGTNCATVPGGLGGDVAELKRSVDAIFDHKVVDFSTARYERGIISASDGQWKSVDSSANSYSSYLLSVNPAHDISVTMEGHETRETTIAFLKNDTRVNNQVADFCSGTSLSAVAADTTAEFTIPTDCAYIAIKRRSNSGDYTPQSLTIKSYDAVEIDDTLSVSGKAADAKVTGDNLDVLNQAIYTEMTPESFVNGKYITKASGGISSSSSWARTDFISVADAIKIVFSCPVGTNNAANNVAAMAFYSNQSNSSYLSDATISPDVGDAGYTEKIISVPEGAKYIRCSLYAADKENFYIKIVYSLRPKLLNGKVIAIMGDSISTNGNSGDDSNVPEILISEEDIGVTLKAYLTYDDTHEQSGGSWVEKTLTIGGVTFTAADMGTEITFTPTADDVGKCVGLPHNYNANSVVTWWEKAALELGFNAIPVCWSGSSISSHEYNQPVRMCSYAWHPSQIRKCGIRTPGTTGFDENGNINRTAPDVIIIYRGTNDMTHTPYDILTDDYFAAYNWQYPENDQVTGGYGFKEAYCKTISELRAVYPNALILLCTLNVFKRVNYSHFPTNNGINSLPQYNAAIREIAEYMGCGLIEFDRDGITFENCYTGGYITDSATQPTHPSNKGHAVMGQRAINDIKLWYQDLNL